MTALYWIEYIKWFGWTDLLYGPSSEDVPVQLPFLFWHKTSFYVEKKKKHIILTLIVVRTRFSLLCWKHFSSCLTLHVFTNLVTCSFVKVRLHYTPVLRTFAPSLIQTITSDTRSLFRCGLTGQRSHLTCDITLLGVTEQKPNVTVHPQSRKRSQGRGFQSKALYLLTRGRRVRSDPPQQRLLGNREQSSSDRPSSMLLFFVP